MRREFILVLLGIISTSTFTSIVTNYFQVETDKVLMDTVVGSVGAGNFSYWHLGHTGPLLVELTSISGDADLYVADNVRPSYEVDKNNFSSATCGLDVVKIPGDFPRPIGIGVFGHWSHSVSDYSIQVFLDLSAMLVINGEVYAPVHKIPHSNEKQDTERHKEKPPRSEDTRPPFSKLLNMLDVILDMFVL